MRNDFNRPLQRILMVVPYANWAGTERHVLILGNELLVRGWDVTVLSPPGPAEQWWCGAQLKVETFTPPAGGLRRMISSLRQQAMAWLFRGRDANSAQVKRGIVHVHGAPELLFLLRHLRPTAGMVFTSHGFFGHNVRWDYWWAARAGRRWADLVIAVSRSEADRLLRHGLPPSRIRVIRNGIVIPSSSSFAIPPHDRSPRQSAWSVGFVGRLTSQKGLEYLLQALPLVLAHMRTLPPHVLPLLPAPDLPRVKLWVVGDGPEKPRLTDFARRLTMAEPGLAVEFVGAVANVTPWWQQFDIFVLPSLDESFGLVVAEAMAAGLPVIASRLPATTETILDGETGLLVPPADPAALASAIVRLMTDSKLRQRLGENARRYARANLSAACMAAQTERLYLQLLSP